MSTSARPATSFRNENGTRAPASATYAAQLGAAVLSFANVLVVSRVLGPSGRGEVAYLTTIAVLSSNVALFGLQEANANIAASESERRRSLATNSIVLSI